MKPRSEFYRHPGMADGLLGKCKECTRVDVRSNYATKLVRYRAYERQRNATPDRRAQLRAAHRRHVRRHPERTRARRAVQYALSVGNLHKEPCADCGAEYVEAHHHDYARPLDVTWLCRTCHRRREGRLIE